MDIGGTSAHLDLTMGSARGWTVMPGENGGWGWSAYVGGDRDFGVASSKEQAEWAARGALRRLERGRGS